MQPNKVLSGIIKMIFRKKYYFKYIEEHKYFILSTIFLTFFSSLRHYWFHSSSWDLGIFEQAIFLISKGQTPFSTILGFHILGDHGALILYPLALIYKFFPTTYFLFFIQSTALAASIYPLRKLSNIYQLSKAVFQTSYLAFLLYPIIFNINIFDFHPEVLAFPIFLDIFVSFKEGKRMISWAMFLKILFILSCKITNSFLLIGFGIWLIFKGFRKSGYLLILFSTLWFNFIAFSLIPHFGGENASIIRQASKFGINEEVKFDLFAFIKIVLQLFIQLFSISNLEYLTLLLLPFIYILLNKKRFNFLLNFIPFFPLLFLNLVSDSYPMKNLVHQYSLFIVPSIAISIQESLSPIFDDGIKNYPIWFQRNATKVIIFWCVLTFIIFSRFTFFFGPFQSYFESSNARREAIELIKDTSSVLTTNELVPHLSKRKNIKFTDYKNDYNLEEFDEILLDLKKPGWQSNIKFINEIHKYLKSNNLWIEKYKKNDIILFEKIN